MIQKFHLIQKSEIKHFQVFGNEEAGIILTVTGVGSVAAATAVGSICTAFHVNQGKGEPEDFLVNVGICSGNISDTHCLKETSRIYFCNKITENATGRTFYPDVLYRHGFEETEVTTMECPVCMERNGLHDMEASAVYQAGSHFFGPHQMSFLKVVSDNGRPDSVTPQMAESFIGSQMPGISEYIFKLSEISRNGKKEYVLGEEEEKFLEKLSGDMHCSVTMKASLRQYVIYGKLAGIDYQKAAEEMYAKKILPCGSKREGKLCFEEFRKQLL